jgi:DNA-binding transcriptional LysR family regulator
MELRQLEYFAAVVRHGHFGRAAQDVYVTQSALSQQISRLEDELGLTLLMRSPKGVELTPAGLEFIDHARGIHRPGGRGPCRHRRPSRRGPRGGAGGGNHV